MLPRLGPEADALGATTWLDETAAVSGTTLRFAWYRLRITLGRRWTGYLGLVLLIAVLGGVAMASIAGARRTQSSYPAFLASTNPSDLVVSSFGVGTVATSNNVANTVSTATMLRLPHVREVHSVDAFIIAPLSAGGAPEMDTLGQVEEVASVDGFGFVQDRFGVVKGRLPATTSTDEFVTTVLGANALGIHIGQSMTFGEYTAEQTLKQGFGTSEIAPHVTIRATLVGLVVLNNQVVQDDIDRYPTFAIFPPGLGARLAPDASATLTGLRLEHGAADVSAVEQEFQHAVPPGSTYEFHETANIEGRVERAVRPESIALGTFGAIAAAAGLAIFALAGARLVQSTEHEIGVFRALGASPRTAVVNQVLGVLAAVVVGALAAGGVAVALSPLAPLGPVRPVYPHRGVAADWTVLSIGVAVFVLVPALCVVGAGVRSYVQQVRTSRTPGAVRTSSVAHGAAAAGLPVSVTVGARFALEPGAGRTAVPVRSAIAGAVLAVVTVVATLTFGSSLHTLVSRPALYGWNWTYLLNAGNDVPPATLTALQHDPDVAGASGFGELELEIDGRNVPTLMTPVPESVSPPILSGHALAADNQIVLGPATLAQLHKHIGETVDVSYGVPADAPAYVPSTPLTVVGTATMPAIGFTSLVADHTSMGTGAIVASGIQPPAFVTAMTSSDPNASGPAVVAVRMQPHLSAAASRADIDRQTAAANAVIDKDPMLKGSGIIVQTVQRPAEIVNYRSTGSTPVVLAAGLAVGALAALALTLMSSVRRRRREFAVLKTLGCTPRQVMSVVTVQALVPAAVGVAVGIPVGIASGRLLWDAFARTIYVVPQPTVPVAAIALVGVGAILFACIIATLPGLRAARIRIAAVLRAE